MSNTKESLTVLVAEDSSSARFALCDFLKKKGYNVIEAVNGREAVKQAKEKLPDIISLDVDMPELNGFEACQKIREDKNTQSIPVVFVTGKDTLDDRKRGFELGAVDFISKKATQFWITVATTIDKILRPKITMRDLTALVVESDEASQQVIVSCLSQQGVHPLVAKNESEVKRIISQKTPLDLIFTEVENLEFDGKELCRYIRNQGHLKDIPLILLCTDNYREHVLEFFEAGITDYLIKPCSQEELLARILIHIEAQRLLKDLKDEMNKNQQILDSAGEAIFGLDTSGVITFANPEAAKMFGYSIKELINQNLHELAHHTDPKGKYFPAENCPIFKSYTQAKEIRTLDDVFWHKDGSALSVKCVSVPTTKKGRHTGAVVTISDISAEKREEALRLDVERITRHDLKTPLNGIIGIPTILMGDDNLTEKQVDYLSLLKESGYRMMTMINDSLNLFKMEKGTYDFHPEKIDLLTTIAHISKDMQLIENKNLSLQITINGQPKNEGDTFFVQGEEILCYSMIANLLKNATEASPDDGNISIGLSKESNSSVIKIHNMGAVPESMRTTFFDKYATADKSGGTGLGTYSALLLAKTQKGMIELESSDQEGTTLTIKLPD